MKPTIAEFVTDPQLLGLSILPTQETLLRCSYGLPPADADQVSIFRQCTGCTAWPLVAFGEVTVIAGARSGKDSGIAVPIVPFRGIVHGPYDFQAVPEAGRLLLDLCRCVGRAGKLMVFLPGPPKAAKYRQPFGRGSGLQIPHAEGGM